MATRTFEIGDAIMTADGWFGHVDRIDDEDGRIGILTPAAPFFDLLPPAALRKATVTEIRAMDDGGEGLGIPEADDYLFMLAFEASGQCVAVVQGDTERMIERLDVAGFDATDPDLRFVPVRLSNSPDFDPDWEELVIDLEKDPIGEVAGTALANLPEEYRYAIGRKSTPAIVAKMTADEVVTEIFAIVADNQKGDDGPGFSFGLLPDGWLVMASELGDQTRAKMALIVSKDLILPAFQSADHFDMHKREAVAALIEDTKDRVIWPAEEESLSLYRWQIALDAAGRLVCEGDLVDDLDQDVVDAVGDAAEDDAFKQPIRLYRVRVDDSDSLMGGEKPVYHGRLIIGGDSGQEMFCFAKRD